eukprot:TRINITY_DN4768_c0_g1_i6.p1 TRINITY_DN4768_c0_g1~~TRINITY_DN4768_c0_g1_i6.p1  ORF type:complete len:984 (-),score=136.80 TRINITY_DN4768_c0_g1_i6:1197-4148(-)
MLRKGDMTMMAALLLCIGMIHIMWPRSSNSGETSMSELPVGTAQMGISSRKLQAKDGTGTEILPAGIINSQSADTMKASMQGNADSSSENLLPAQAWLRGQVNIPRWYGTLSTGTSSQELHVKSDTGPQIQHAGIISSQSANTSAWLRGQVNIPRWYGKLSTGISSQQTQIQHAGSETADTSNSADLSNENLLPALAWLRGQIDLSRWYDPNPPDELLQGRLSRDMCRKKILPDSLIYDHIDWYTHGEKLGEWLQRYSGTFNNPICWGDGAEKEQWFADLLTGKRCDRPWMVWSESDVPQSSFQQYTKEAPAVLGLDPLILAYCRNLTHDTRKVPHVNDPFWKTWKAAGMPAPEKMLGPMNILEHNLLLGCARANRNILRVSAMAHSKASWDMCANVEWVVCAAKGMLPNQGKTIEFAVPPGNLDGNLASTYREYKSHIMRFSAHYEIDIMAWTFYLNEICWLSELCDNADELWTLERGEPWVCQHTDEGGQRLKFSLESAYHSGKQKVADYRSAPARMLSSGGHSPCGGHSVVGGNSLGGHSVGGGHPLCGGLAAAPTPEPILSPMPSPTPSPIPLPTPSPTPSPSPSPSPTPSPTPTPSPLPALTPDPPSPTPSPSPSPSPTPSPTPTPLPLPAPSPDPPSPTSSPSPFPILHHRLLLSPTPSPTPTPSPLPAPSPDPSPRLVESPKESTKQLNLAGNATLVVEDAQAWLNDPDLLEAARLGLANSFNLPSDSISVEARLIESRRLDQPEDSSQLVLVEQQRLLQQTQTIVLDYTIVMEVAESVVVASAQNLLKTVQAVTPEKLQETTLASLRVMAPAKVAAATFTIGNLTSADKIEVIDVATGQLAEPVDLLTPLPTPPPTTLSSTETSELMSSVSAIVIVFVVLTGLCCLCGAMYYFRRKRRKFRGSNVGPTDAVEVAVLQAVMSTGIVEEPPVRLVLELSDDTWNPDEDPACGTMREARDVNVSDGTWNPDGDPCAQG